MRNQASSSTVGWIEGNTSSLKFPSTSKVKSVIFLSSTIDKYLWNAYEALGLLVHREKRGKWAVFKNYWFCLDLVHWTSTKAHQSHTVNYKNKNKTSSACVCEVHRPKISGRLFFPNRKRPISEKDVKLSFLRGSRLREGRAIPEGRAAAGPQGSPRAQRAGAAPRDSDSEPGPRRTALAGFPAPGSLLPTWFRPFPSPSPARSAASLSPPPPESRFSHPFVLPRIGRFYYSAWTIRPPSGWGSLTSAAEPGSSWDFALSVTHV